jgi:GDP-fucose transporter C1
MNCRENGSYVTGVIVTYWIVSITMVYLNKFLMTNNEMSIPAPLFITWFQCVITSCICYIAGYLGDRAQKRMLMNDYDSSSIGNGGGGLYSKLNNSDLDATNSSSSNNSISSNIISNMNNHRPSFISQFPKATYKPSIAIQILPLSVIFVGMITFNNLCLTYVQVSFYNVARSLTIVFNIFISWMALGIKSSAKTVTCLIIVIFGFYIGSQGELNFSTIGTNCGILSSLFVSLNSIYTKKVLSIVDDNHWKLTFYNNINACVILFPFVYKYELNFILMEHAEQIENMYFWCLMTLAGFLGFMIGIVTVLQIKATSPLCHNFSGTCKALVQSMLAFYIWKNEPTKEGVAGIVIVLGGSLLYTYVKMNENSSSTINGMKTMSDAEMPLAKSGER